MREHPGFIRSFDSKPAPFVVSRHQMGVIRAVLGSIFMGSGIAAMHYTGMAAASFTASPSVHGKQ
ncbi:MAG: hypothetical protein DMG31_00815 [Acidobacteria bacterium]|nr:MAG: hypothetical protein DMG31_00815 [Acidobacteriota bacterium]